MRCIAEAESRPQLERCERPEKDFGRAAPHGLARNVVRQMFAGDDDATFRRHPANVGHRIESIEREAPRDLRLGHQRLQREAPAHQRADNCVAPGEHLPLGSRQRACRQRRSLAVAIQDQSDGMPVGSRLNCHDNNFIGERAASAFINGFSRLA